MKALSLKMPWPYLIFYNGKDVENRRWSTEYRGNILIHASKNQDPFMVEIVARSLPDSLPKNIVKLLKWCGNLVGTIELVDCIKDSKSPWAEEGQWHWILRNPILFEKPIPCKGALGLWEYSGNISGRAIRMN